MVRLADRPSDVLPRGLDGVPVATTSVSDVDGVRGFYHFRGVDPTTFARTGTFEDAWHLLHEGELPTTEQRAAFAERIHAAMQLPPVLRDALPALAALGPPGSQDVLRSAVSAAGVAIGCRPWTEQDRETTDEQVVRHRGDDAGARRGAVPPRARAGADRSGPGPHDRRELPRDDPRRRPDRRADDVRSTRT